MASKRYPIKPFFGLFIIAKREFFANLKSVRMLVLMALFILAVLGGTYGITRLSTTTTLPEVEVLAWALLGDYDGYGYSDDLVVRITDGEGDPIFNAEVEYVSFEDDSEEVFFDGYTDQDGVAIIQNISFSMLGTYVIKVTHDNKEYGPVKTSYAIELSPKPVYIFAQSLDLDDDNVEDDALAIVTDINGTPIANAEVTITSSNYENSGLTNSKGIITFTNLKAGRSGEFGTVSPKNYDVEVTYSGSTSTNSFKVYQDDESRANLFELEGPDEIIYVIASIFIIMLGPIIAIALSFDSITKEKLQKSLDFLLCRPTGRRNIILGKFMGILSAIALPVTVINLLAVALISSVTQESPTGTLVAGFIGYTIVFIAIYILLQQIFSTLAKTTGTAILSGIAVWLIFNMFWTLISVGVGAILGYQFGSDAWVKMNNQIALLNPSGAYQLALGFLLPQEGGANVTMLGVSNWMPPVVMVIWLIVMFLLATKIFVKKADS